MNKKTEMSIEYEYNIITKAMEELKGKVAKDKGNIFVKILRSHQKIELLKIPTFIELTKDYVYQNFNVVIFVNFTKTLESLSKMLSSNCLVYGGQSSQEREQNIADFRADKERIIICNIKAGGIGISLHDINGKYRRVSLISPCWNAIDMTQALGRIHRAGSKSPALQRLLYCDNTIETNIATRLKIKFKNLQNINDGDLSIDLKNIHYVKDQKNLSE
jgi:superfamily II DNA or RNA helicase